MFAFGGSSRHLIHRGCRFWLVEQRSCAPPSLPHDWRKVSGVPIPPRLSRQCQPAPSAETVLVSAFKVRVLGIAVPEVFVTANGAYTARRHGGSVDGMQATAT